MAPRLRQDSLLYRARFAIGLFGLTILTGVLGYMMLLDLKPIDALYFTIVTLSTVGYGDIVPKGGNAELFTVLFILGGILTALYSSSVLIGSIVEGEVQGVMMRRRELRRIRKMKNHTIICGLGRIGNELAQSFADEDAPFLVIENREEACLAGENCGYTMLRGDATLDATLLEAGIERARHVLPVLSSDADNLFIVISARQLNPSLNIIARATDAAAEHKMKRAGADQVIRPLHLGAQHLAQAVLRPAIRDFMFLPGRARGQDYALEELAVMPGSALSGESLAELDRDLLRDIMVVGIKSAEGEMTFNPPPDVLVRDGDTLITIGPVSEMTRLSEIAAKKVPE